MRKIFFVVFIILIFPCFAFGDVYDYPQSLENISKQIPKPENIKCKFKQERYLKNIKNPIVSGGDFEFVKSKGVCFLTTYPVVTKTDYTNKNYRQINDIISAISSKKYSKIEKEFNFYYEVKNSDWTLGMKPKKNSKTSDFIKSITICGKDYIKKIETSQTNGNKTVLWFIK